MRVKRLSMLLGVAATALLLVAVTSASGAPANRHKSTAKVLITTRTVPGLGKILVNAKGRTLYMFVPDKRKKVTCVSTCAKIWPPLFLRKGAKVVAKGGVKAKLLGSDSSPAGGRVVTYHGWPLYLYLGDRKPGDAFGQALNLNGGLWYVLAPSGKLIKKKLNSGGSSSGSGGSGGSGSTTTTTTTKTTTPTKTTTTPKTTTGICGTDDDADNDQGGGAPDDGDGCI